MVKRVIRILVFPITVILSLSKGALLLLMAGAIALSVATATVSSVFNMVSSAVEAVVGPRTVRAKHTARLSELSGEGAALRNRTSELANENQRLTREMDDMEIAHKKSTSALKDENRLLTQELAERKVNYRGQARHAREAVKDTSGRLARRVTLASSRNVASVFAEALPFVGVGVIVGATVWELKDSCEMMNDLHELDVAFNPESAIDGTEVCGMGVPTQDEIWKKINESPEDAWEAAKASIPDLPDFSGAYVSGIEWVMAVACGVLPCEDVEGKSE